MARTEYAIRLAKPSLCRELVDVDGEHMRKSAINWRLCEQKERRARLRGCGCPTCQPELYDRSEPIFDACKGLQYRKQDAWDLALMAVKSFARLKLGQSQLTALISWSVWASRNLSHPRPLDDGDIQTVAGIFNEAFFLGALPSSKLVIFWDHLHYFRYGETQPSANAIDPEIVRLNASIHSLQCSRVLAIRVILHEMVHAFLSRYTCYPWHTVECASGRCGQSYRVHVGVSGHGRAFHYIAKAIEDDSFRLLGLQLPLGRGYGSVTELMGGGGFPCHRDKRRLYTGRHFEVIWKHLAESQDDSLIMTGILLGVSKTKRLLRRARRLSDTVLLEATQESLLIED
ncbi:hypothetical protein AC578_5618 [Pseudocercospora eumusae]|uniref:C2H2-type domain-containing protein n=1 Tax=Pseudocercospora eumusae TaxID=321146 RepID=A0A139HT44_9PEZI|nr:hypothetical protein AC578_5618 [Pseudocercospora eumusae]